ncbi:cystathionine gamma-synthase [Nocardioides sp. LML1-1-1.1]|uniref:cystathionine gamma-synthase n=1 Tax=Nocardioides sp. LML1-1-1.1 TaxID=3135248 RepID=UPI0034306BCB
MQPSDSGFATRAIHDGQESDPLTGAVVPPIYAVSTFHMDRVNVLRAGYDYSRSTNPTRTALETCLASLEGGVRGLAFGSGQAATDALLRTVCAPGDHVLIPGDAYGGTYRLFAKVYARWGVEYTPVPLDDLDAVRAALRPTTKLIWCETPTNPLLRIADLAALAQIAHDAGARLAVDNTFASPALQNPIALGADAVMHSTTKYLGGHSDVIGGALVAGDEELGEELYFHQNVLGAVAGPFDAWLVLRGIKSLALRIDRHCANAEAIVDMLLQHPKVTEVFYPGLPDHPGHDIAARQMRGFGGMVSFRVAGGAEEARAVCERARLFTLAFSLGGVESLIEYPAEMTHAAVSGSSLEVPDDLVRLSVGVEDVDDLKADLFQALG